MEERGSPWFWAIVIAMFISSAFAVIGARRFLPTRVYIDQNLSTSDGAAIVGAIEQSAEVQEKRILSIISVKPKQVEVETGEMRGPLDGGGQLIRFEKQKRSWVITQISYWMS